MVLEQVTLPLVIITALIDSINPCAIGVLLLLVATLVQVAHDKKKLLVIGFIYIFFVFITYISPYINIKISICSRRFSLLQSKIKAP